MDMRELKGLELAARKRIPFRAGYWLVPSPNVGKPYRVKVEDKAETCECEDYALTAQPCKHIHAVRFTLERDHQGRPPVVDTDNVPKRKTYKQDWPKYNLVQSTEKDRFQEVLADLCAGVPVPERTTQRGRPATPLADRIFASVFKVYSTLSVRRFMSDLREAHERGHISHLMHFNQVSAFLEEPTLTPILRDLITRTSLPLKAVEETFAVDSSGFTTAKFIRWYDHKYGVHREKHNWVKVHVACGTKTHIVTAVVIAGPDASDCPQLPELVKATAANFSISEVSGDKGYSSLDNLEAVEAVGGTPFIAFRKNAKPSRGGLEPASIRV